MRTLSAVVCLLVLPAMLHAATADQVPVRELGDLAKVTNWSGLEPGKDGAVLAVPGEANVQCGDVAGNNADWFSWYGVRFDIRLDDERPLRLDVVLRTPEAARDHKGVAASMVIQGAGWHPVTLPWSSFSFPEPADFFLHQIKELALVARYEDGKPGRISLRHAQVVRAPVVWLDAGPRGKSVDAGATAEYPVTVANCTDGPQAIALSFQTSGFEAMTASVSPERAKETLS